MSGVHTKSRGGMKLHYKQQNCVSHSLHPTNLLEKGTRVDWGRRRERSDGKRNRRTGGK